MLLRFVLVLLLALSCWGRNIAILVDASGTMAHYGRWQPEARRLAASLLSGRVDETGWTHEGNADSGRDFAVSNGDRIHLLKFGSIKTKTFPFFSEEEVVTSVHAFEDIFPLDASAYAEAKTNKSLAMAVGAALSAEDATSLMIVVSDFLIDSDLNPEQEQFVNAFESKAKIETPMIFTWLPDPRVQVKLLHVSGLSGVNPPPPPPQDCSVQIVGARFFGSPKRVAFSWQLTGATCEATYSVTVRDPRSNAIAFTRSGLLTPSLLWANPPSGKFLWQVTAALPDEKQLFSPVVPIEVSGDSMVGVVALLLCLVVGSGCLWHYSKRNKTAAGSAAKGK